MKQTIYHCHICNSVIEHPEIWNVVFSEDGPTELLECEKCIASHYAENGNHVYISTYGARVVVFTLECKGMAYETMTYFKFYVGGEEFYLKRVFEILTIDDQIDLKDWYDTVEIENHISAMNAII